MLQDLLSATHMENVPHYLAAGASLVPLWPAYAHLPSYIQLRKIGVKMNTFPPFHKAYSPSNKYKETISKTILLLVKPVLPPPPLSKILIFL